MYALCRINACCCTILLLTGACVRILYKPSDIVCASFCIVLVVLLSFSIQNNSMSTAYVIEMHIEIEGTSSKWWHCIRM
jgi:hypothetical protein